MPQARKREEEEEAEVTEDKAERFMQEEEMAETLHTHDAEEGKAILTYRKDKMLSQRRPLRLHTAAEPSSLVL